MTIILFVFYEPVGSFTTLVSTEQKPLFGCKKEIAHFLLYLWVNNANHWSINELLYYIIWHNVYNIVSDYDLLRIM